MDLKISQTRVRSGTVLTSCNEQAAENITNLSVKNHVQAASSITLGERHQQQRYHSKLGVPAGHT